MDQNLIVPFLLFNENQQWNLVFGWGGSRVIKINWNGLRYSIADNTVCFCTLKEIVECWGVSTRLKSITFMGYPILKNSIDDIQRPAEY